MKIRLIENWQDCYKFWSLQLSTLGTVIVGLFVAYPEAAIYTWSLMPGEFKASIPAQFMPLIGVSVLVLSIIARVVRQESLRKGTNDTQTA